MALRALQSMWWVCLFVASCTCAIGGAVEPGDAGQPPDAGAIDSGAGGGPADAGSPDAGASDPFVRVRGKQLVLDGRPWFSLGANWLGPKSVRSYCVNPNPQGPLPCDEV